MDRGYQAAGRGTPHCSLDFFTHSFHSGGTHIDFHAHPNLEVVYYAQGDGTTQIGELSHDYYPGSFAVILPNMKHNEYRRENTEVIFFSFGGDLGIGEFAHGLYADGDRRLETLLRAMSEELAGKRRHYDISLHGLLYQAIAEVARSTGTAEHTGRSEKVKYAVNYMNQYLAENIDLHAIARNLGYSYDHFRHFFKRETGYSPTQFLLRRRVDKAKRLLVDTDRPMTDIAAECGFGSAPQFSMLFTRLTGSAPRDFRKLSRIR